MPKLSDIRRIVIEDFSEEDQEVASKIAGSYNEFADEIYNLVNGQLDFENLNRAKVVYDVVVNASGEPQTGDIIKVDLTGFSGCRIIDIKNLTNSATRFTQTPSIYTTYKGNGIIKVDYFIGLTLNNKYRVTLEVIA